MYIFYITSHSTIRPILQLPLPLVFAKTKYLDLQTTNHFVIFRL